MRSRRKHCYYCRRKVQWKNIMRHMRTMVCLNRTPAKKMK